MKSQKPYFSKEVVDKIINVISCEVEQGSFTKEIEQALRVYIQSGKNAYENSILEGVAQGVFLASIQDDEIAYKAVPPTKEQVEDVLNSSKGEQKPTFGQVELVLKQQRVARLTHALNMVGQHKIKKLNLPQTA